MAQVPTRTVAVICAVSLTVGWLLASTLTPPVAQLQSLPARAERPSQQPAESTFAEQLHFRMQQAPEPPAPRRNPFQFRAEVETRDGSSGARGARRECGLVARGTSRPVRGSRCQASE